MHCVQILVLRYNQNRPEQSKSKVKAVFDLIGLYQLAWDILINYLERKNNKAGNDFIK